MCRLLGVISTEPVDASFYLDKAPQSLFVQSGIDKRRRQGDGWGMGWFEGGQPRVFKSPRPLYRDRARLRDAVRLPRGNILVGHVRWASNPLKLPRRELIGLPHTQPFKHGPWLFAHNGTLYIPREARAALGPWARYVRGNNDSEVLFYWLMKTVVQRSQGGRWAPLLRDSLRELNKLWIRCRARHPLYKYPYHGLNWVLTNGRVLLGFCCVDSRGFDKAKALCRRGQSYYQLQVQRTENAIAIASEPLTRERAWRPLGHGRLLVAQREGRRLLARTYQVMS